MVFGLWQSTVATGIAPAHRPERVVRHPDRHKPNTVNGFST